ncbi:MAG: 3-hydroxyacyl-ACP dehydratase FabZ [Pseudomonadota bacterium]
MTQLEPGLDTLYIDDIKKILPHRYPFLMIDRLTNIDPGTGAVGIKNISVNEELFQGHFPQQPVFPGVLMIEAMAQSAATYAAYIEGIDTESKVILFMGVDRAKFRRPVIPGDQLELHVSIAQRRPPVWRFTGVAKVDGKKVAEADFSAMLSDPPKP